MSAAYSRQSHRKALGPDPNGRTAAAAAIGCRLDDAITLLREILPGCGLKLIVPPPLPNGNRGRVSLSAWRRGDASARVHSGTSARDAMLLLIPSQAAA